MSATPMFEHKACNRCGGSGKYSFNMMDGDRCYGCGGSGFNLTKRGAAARKWLIEKRSVAARDLVVGQRIYFDMFFSKFWADLTEVTVQENGRVKLDCIRRGETCSIIESADTLIPIGISAERLEELQREALAYQETLTQKGEPSKARTKKDQPINNGEN